jgi:steroid delta-isomerase-like uncharacterized protein
MTVETPTLVDFTQRYAAAWNGRDASAIDALITDDIVWHDPAMPQPARSKADVRAFMELSWRAFPDLRFSEPDPPFLVAQHDRIAWGWRMQGTFSGGPLEPPGFAPTGRAMDVRGTDEWVMRDGRIAHYRAHYDVNGLARQLGIVPEAGSRAERAMVAMQRLQARAMRRR